MNSSKKMQRMGIGRRGSKLDKSPKTLKNQSANSSRTRKSSPMGSKTPSEGKPPSSKGKLPRRKSKISWPTLKKDNKCSNPNS